MTQSGTTWAFHTTVLRRYDMGLPLDRVASDILLVCCIVGHDGSEARRWLGGRAPQPVPGVRCGKQLSCRQHRGQRNSPVRDTILHRIICSLDSCAQVRTHGAVCQPRGRRDDALRAGRGCGFLMRPPTGKSVRFVRACLLSASSPPPTNLLSRFAWSYG